MTAPREEIYAINIKGGQRGSLTVNDIYYMVGNPIGSYEGKQTLIKNISMAITGDKLFLYFEDESRMVIGYDPQKIDLFYRPVKVKKEVDIKKEEG